MRKWLIIILKELVEFCALLAVGLIVVFFLTGTWEYTGILITVDIIQNLILWIWFKLHVKEKLIKLLEV